MSGTRSEMMRYCAVLGCRSTTMELRMWKKGPCDLHGGVIREKCGCPEPFALHPFPTTPKLQYIWLQRIGLPELKVSDASRVCSLHFVEGKPTNRSFFPTLYLDYEIPDEDEGGSDHEMHPQIDSTYSCAETLNDSTGDEESTSHNNHHIDYNPVEYNDSEEHNQNDQDFVDQEEDSGSQGPQYTSGGDASLEATSGNEMVIPEGDDDEVVMIGEKESTANTDDDDVQVMYEKPKTSVPLASYDPQAQVLQISNPVKYISECHKRIAELLAEKEEMKTAYEKEIERLKYLNTSLKRRFLNSNKIFITSTSQSLGMRKTHKKKVKLASSVVNKK